MLRFVRLPLRQRPIQPRKRRRNPSSISVRRIRLLWRRFIRSSVNVIRTRTLIRRKVRLRIARKRCRSGWQNLRISSSRSASSRSVRSRSLRTLFRHSSKSYAGRCTRLTYPMTERKSYAMQS